MPKKKSLLQKIASKLKKTFYRKTKVILAAKYLLGNGNAVTNVVYRPFTENDIKIFASGFSDLAALYREATDNYTGMVAELDGTPACCIWYTDKTKKNEGIPPFTFTVTLPPGGVYIFANYVLPEFRGSKIFITQPSMMLSMLYKKGYRVAVIALFEPRIMKYYQKKDFFVVGNLHFKRYFSCITKSDISDLERLCAL